MVSSFTSATSLLLENLKTCTWLSVCLAGWRYLISQSASQPNTQSLPLFSTSTPFTHTHHLSLVWSLASLPPTPLVDPLLHPTLVLHRAQHVQQTWVQQPTDARCCAACLHTNICLVVPAPPCRSSSPTSWRQSKRSSSIILFLGTTSPR